MFKIFKIFLIFIVVIVIAVIGFSIWLFNGINSAANNAAQKLTIEKGQTVLQLAAEFKQSGLIKSDFQFKLLAKIKGLAAHLKAGDFTIPADVSMDQLVNILIAGPARSEKTILVKEGMTIKAIEEYLKKENLISDGSFQKIAGGTVESLPDGLKGYPSLTAIPPGGNLEGFLFPDTYSLFASDNGEALIKKMLDNFQAKLRPELVTEIAAQKKQLYEIIIMASLIEKEVRHPADMKTVSGIFYNRLKRGQRLESDATLSYALGDNTPGHSLAQTAIDNPYNTYRNEGLPPGPIANPGIEAIEAAIYPATTSYNFFLTDPATGNTIWARTFEEHKANKLKYLK
ncbi:MAG: endolytic transglycosylase MltG [Candidatus Falkowbacteria bacterium]